MKSALRHKVGLPRGEYTLNPGLDVKLTELISNCVEKKDACVGLVELAGKSPILFNGLRILMRDFSTSTLLPPDRAKASITSVSLNLAWSIHEKKIDMAEALRIQEMIFSGDGESLQLANELINEKAGYNKEVKTQCLGDKSNGTK